MFRPVHSFLSSVGYAVNGIKTCFKEERNFRIQVVLALLAVAVGLMLQISPTKWMVLLLCIGMVLGAELFNSAIERWVDLVQPEKDARAGLIKDLAAGAVLVVSGIALAVGLLIFLPELF